MLMDKTEGQVIDVLLRQRGVLEGERSGLLAQVAQRNKAIDALNGTIAILRGLPSESLEGELGQAEPTAKPAQTRRSQSVDLDDLATWAGEFASAQTKPFGSGAFVDWMLESGKIAYASAYTKKIATDALRSDPRIEMLGTGAQTKYRWRDQKSLAGQLSGALAEVN